MIKQNLYFSCVLSVAFMYVQSVGSWQLRVLSKCPLFSVENRENRETSACAFMLDYTAFVLLRKL